MTASARSERQLWDRASNGTSKERQLKRQVSKETFHKWQWTYKREHQSMTMAWLRAEMDDQDKSLVSKCFGALIVGSMRLECVGSKTSPGHGPIVQATIKWATSPTMPTVSHTKRPWCTFVLSHTVRYYCTMYLNEMCQVNILWWPVKLHCGMTKFRLLSNSYFHSCE